MQQSNSAHTGRLSRVFDRVAVAAIGGYQRYLSPHKGFSCAHRVLYGGASCSQYIKCQIQGVGLAQATVMARQRFAACREANQILKMRCRRQMGISHQSSKKRRWRDSDCARSCNYYDCISCSSCDCGDFDLPEFDGLDCGDCGDVGDCVDVGECGNSLDCCSVGDCGSCG